MSTEYLLSNNISFVDSFSCCSHDTFSFCTCSKSLNSISRRLKELVLAAVAPGEDLSSYDLLVTGHSLGGALATCFVMDIAQYGVDAGRGLPQLEPSENWWSSIASTLTGKQLDSKATPPSTSKAQISQSIQLWFTACRQ